MREQNRYIVFEVICDAKPGYNATKEAILGSCKYYMGAVGFAKASPMFIKNKWDDEKQEGILKVNRKYVDWVKASLALITSIKNNKVIVRSRNVSGILKKAS